MAVDPTPELPRGVESFRGEGLVALIPPLPEQAALRVVASFFRAVVADDTEQLATLLTPDANATTSSRPSSTTVLDHWRGRAQHFKYQSLGATTLYQDVDVELYRYQDLETLLSGRPLRPSDMGRSDLLLKVPLQVVRVGNERLFGDEIFFVLRRDKDRFLIRQTIEDFQAQ